MWAIEPKFASRAAASQGNGWCVLRVNGWRRVSADTAIELLWAGRFQQIVITATTKRSQLLAAWVCLVAAILLFTPLAEAAWSAHAAACCTGDHCPIPEHHHSKTPQHTADCEHQSGGLEACSMSCCQKSDHPMLTSLAFLLPDAALPIVSKVITTAAIVPQASDMPRSLEVLSPPPRLSSITL